MRSIASHLVVPTIVIGLASTAAMIRRMRANLLDELQKQYVVTARAKGLSEGRLLLKYPFRMSLNPFIADIGALTALQQRLLRKAVTLLRPGGTLVYCTCSLEPEEGEQRHQAEEDPERDRRGPNRPR